MKQNEPKWSEVEQSEDLLKQRGLAKTVELKRGLAKTVEQSEDLLKQREPSYAKWWN